MLAAMHSLRKLLPLAVVLLLVGCASKPKTVRFATFNASLNRDKQGQLLQDLATGQDQQIRNVAEIIQRVRPDVLLINEFDYDAEQRGVYLFQKNYLLVAQNGAAPIEFKYHYTGPVNTGIASGFDLDHNGKVVTQPGTRDYGGDALGFGLFPGQYGMVVLSKYPIDASRVRTFQRFKWQDMPGAMLPADPKTGKPWYDEETLKVFRLSSKNHWDVPVKIDEKTTVHVLASHPTPPAFDGPEDRNGKRNHDEIRFWADYILASYHGGYIVDDTGHAGGLEPNITPGKRGLMQEAAAVDEPRFVVMGDENADPADGGSVPGAIQQLLNSPRIDASFIPTSAGAAEAAQKQGGANASHKTDAKYDTADFPDSANGPGNLRCDYVLPSRNLKVLGGGVFWPVDNDPLSRLVKMTPTPASSDHRLVWLDLEMK
jgi:3-phytase